MQQPVLHYPLLPTEGTWNIIVRILMQKDESNNLPP